MKRKIFIMLIFAILLFGCGTSQSALAMDTGFSTQMMQPDEQKTFTTNIQLEKSEKAPVKKNGIVCFDVNEDGLIAAGIKDSSRKSISVYNSFGEYQYGYNFNCNQSFGVEWEGNNLIIYFVRSDVAALVDQSGTILELQKIENTIDNNSYWNHFVFATQRTVDNDKYIIKNDMGLFNIFASSYSQLVVEDAQGNQTILYDVNNAQMTKIIIIFVASILVFVIAVSTIVHQFLKSHKR